MKTLVIALLLVGTTLLNAQAPAKNNVQRIYVSEFEFTSNAPQDFASLIRSKLISSLVEACSSNCRVVEAAGANGDNGQDMTDAILTGTIHVENPDNRHWHIQGAMRLVDKDGDVLWAGTIYNSPFARSASSSFADNTAKKLASFLQSH
jgi:hypothetical protein